jgi:hypothetical protein
VKISRDPIMGLIDKMTAFEFGYVVSKGLLVGKRHYRRLYSIGFNPISATYFSPEIVLGLLQPETASQERLNTGSGPKASFQ